MPNQRDKFNDKKKFIKKVTDDLDNTFQDLSKELLKAVINEFVDNLDRKGDEIKNTPKNLQLIASIDKLYSAFMSGSGLTIAETIIKGTDRLSKFNVDYFSDYAESKSKYQASVKKVKQVIADRLGVGEKTQLKKGGYLDSLLQDVTVRNSIKKLSTREVIKGTGFKGFKKGLEKYIIGDKEKLGAFRQHYRNYAYDIFVQVDREESSLMATELDLQYFIYQGGLIDTSRPFCVKRDGKVFSTEEAEDWVNDPWIQENLKKGTIATYNPVVDCGLYGCRHSIRYISREVAETIRPDLKK